MAISTRGTASEKESFVTRTILALIAEHSATDVESVGAETHFMNDLGYDQLDVLELIIMLENQFGDLDLSEEAEIEFVGDLIREIEMSRAQPNEPDDDVMTAAEAVMEK